MKIIKMFLASSLDELRDDRRKFSEFIGDLNDVLIERDIYLRLFMCEHEDISISQNGGKQEDFNEEIRESDLSVFLFYKRIGEYTKVEFDAACERRQETGGAPQILVFFREDQEETTPELLDFRSGLKNIDYITYSEFDTVKQGILTFLYEKFGVDTSIDDSPNMAVSDRIYVNILFVYSSEELVEDSSEIKGFFRELNDLYVEKGLYFRLIQCRDENDVTKVLMERGGTMKSIGDSDLFIIAFFQETGEETIQRFNDALAHFQEYGKPAILTFFREDNSEPSAAVKKFMDHLAQELGHYYKMYSDVDTMKLYLLMQIQRMGVAPSIVFKDGMAMVDGTLTLSLEKLPELAKNLDLKNFREECERLRQEYEEAKELSNNVDTDENNERRNQARKKWQDSVNNLMKAEEILVDVVCQSVEACSAGNLNELQKKEFEALERGEYRAAYEIYDMDEIHLEIELAQNDIRLGRQLRSAGDKKAEAGIIKLEEAVDKILKKVHVKLYFMIEDDDRYKIAEELYEEAVEIEEKNDLSRRATDEYLIYLRYECDSSDSWVMHRGVEIATDYLDFNIRNGNQKNIADASYRLADFLFESFEDLDYAEELFYNTLKIYQDLSKDDPSPYEYNTAMTHRRLAFLLEIIGDADAQEEIMQNYDAALDIYRRMAEKDPGFDKLTLVYCCFETSSFLDKIGNVDRAALLHHEGMMTGLQLVQEDPETFDDNPIFNMKNLVRILDYQDTEVIIEAETSLRKELECRERRVEDSSGNFGLGYLSSGLQSMAEFLCKRGCNHIEQDEVKQFYAKALDIRQRLVEKYQDSDEKEELCSLYISFAAFLEKYDGVESQNEIESLYSKDIEIECRLAEEDYEEFTFFMFKKSNNLQIETDGAATDLDDYSSYEEKEAKQHFETAKLFKKELEKKIKWVTKDEKLSDEYWAYCLQWLAEYWDPFDSFIKKKYFNEICKNYQEALEIREKLAELSQDPAEKEKLASLCDSVAIFLDAYGDDEYREKAESLHLEASEIRSEIVKDIPKESNE